MVVMSLDAVRALVLEATAKTDRGDSDYPDGFLSTEQWFEFSSDAGLREVLQTESPLHIA
jgi:hypothetical protein